MTRGEILLALLSLVKTGRHVFMVNNITLGLPFEFTIKLKEWMEEMTAAGAFVLYLTTEPVTRDTRFQSNQEYEELQEWDQSVELIKKALAKNREA